MEIGLFAVVNVCKVVILIKEIKCYYLRYSFTSKPRNRIYKVSISRHLKLTLNALTFSQNVLLVWGVLLVKKRSKNTRFGCEWRGLLVGM